MNGKYVTHTLYDSQGRGYATERYSGVAIEIDDVTPSGSPVTIFESIAPTGLSPQSTHFISSTQTWYDAQGRVIETRNSAGLRTGTIYDTAGQVAYSGILNTSAPDGGHSQVLSDGTLLIGFQLSDFVSYSQYLSHQVDTSTGNALIPSNLSSVLSRLLPSALQLGVQLSGALPGNTGLNGAMGLQDVLGRVDGVFHDALFWTGGIGLGGTVNSLGDNIEGGYKPVPTITGSLGAYWNLHNSSQLNGALRFIVTISWYYAPAILQELFEKDIKMEAAKILLAGGESAAAWRQANQLFAKLNGLYGSTLTVSWGTSFTSDPIGLSVNLSPQATKTSRAGSAIMFGSMVQLSPSDDVSF